MRYFCETLTSSRRHFLTLSDNSGRIVASTVVRGTLTEKHLKNLKASLVMYTPMQRMLNFIRG